MKTSIFKIVFLLPAVLSISTAFAIPLDEAKRSFCMADKKKCLRIAQDVVYSSPQSGPAKSEIAINRPEFTDNSLVFSPDTMTRFMQNIVFVSKRKNVYLLNIAENKYIQLAVQGNDFHDEVAKLYVHGFQIYVITTDGKIFEGAFPPNGTLDYNILTVNTRDGEETSRTLSYNQARDLFSELSKYSNVKEITADPKTGKLHVIHLDGKKEALKRLS
jgi:hypothetical protein